MCSGDDDQAHILQCKILLAELTHIDKLQVNNVDYNDIYGDLNQQKTVTDVMDKLLNIRSRLLDLDTSPIG